MWFQAYIAVIFLWILKRLSVSLSSSETRAPQERELEEMAGCSGFTPMKPFFWQISKTGRQRLAFLCLEGCIPPSTTKAEHEYIFLINLSFLDAWNKLEVSFKEISYIW